MTLAEYAAHRKVTRGAIYQKIESGVISERSLVREKPNAKRFQIDSEVADLEIDMHGDASHKVSHDDLHPQADAKTDGAEEPPRLNKYREAKTTTEMLRSRKLELDVAEREGSLVDVKSVQKRVSKLVGEVRDALGNLPGKISPLLLSISDPVEMENKLREEINSCLESLSRLEK